MKTETVVAKSWDDLVFENRNKEYGAYSVRKSYSDRVIYALFISMSVMAIALITPAVLAIMRGEAIPPLIPKTGPGVIFEPKINIVVEPPAHKQSPPPQQSINRNFPPVVTDQPVPPTEELPPVEQLNSGPTETGDGGTSDPGIEAGTGTGPEVANAPVVENKTFLIAEKMPEYVGGSEAMIRFIQRKINYPAADRRNGVDGIVYVQFIVGPNGEIINPQILKGISVGCDAEALRLISLMPNWKPGMQNHSAVSVRMVLPLRFHIES